MDSSLIGGGGVCGNEYFHVKFPVSITQKLKNIAHLEMMSIIIAVKIWGSQLNGKIVHLNCDNQACVEVVNAGKSKEPLLQQCLRELTMFVAQNQIWLKLTYIRSKSNVLPDLLSRWYNTGSDAQRRFKSLINNRMKRCSVPQKLFEFSSL